MGLTIEPSGRLVIWSFPIGQEIAQSSNDDQMTKSPDDQIRKDCRLK
jgi:hypothetical protein